MAKKSTAYREVREDGIIIIRYQSFDVKNIEKIMKKIANEIVKKGGK